MPTNDYVFWSDKMTTLFLVGASLFAALAAIWQWRQAKTARRTRQLYEMACAELTSLSQRCVRLEVERGALERVCAQLGADVTLIWTGTHRLNLVISDKESTTHVRH